MHLIYTGGGKYTNAVRSYKKNGKVKKIYTYLGKVVDKNQGMSIFIRYVSGNIVNFTTLIHTIRELEQQSVGCAYALLGTEYPTNKNLRDMCDSNINFMFRLNSGSDSTRACTRKLSLGLCPQELYHVWRQESLHQKGQM